MSANDSLRKYSLRALTESNERANELYYKIVQAFPAGRDVKPTISHNPWGMFVGWGNPSNRVWVQWKTRKRGSNSWRVIYKCTEEQWAAFLRWLGQRVELNDPEGKKEEEKTIEDKPHVRHAAPKLTAHSIEGLNEGVYYEISHNPLILVPNVVKDDGRYIVDDSAWGLADAATHNLIYKPSLTFEGALKLALEVGDFRDISDLRRRLERGLRKLDPSRHYAPLVQARRAREQNRLARHHTGRFRSQGKT